MPQAPPTSRWRPRSRRLHQRRGWGVAPQWVTGRARLPIAGRLHRGRARQVAMPHRPTLRAVAAAPPRRLPRHRLRRARDSRDPAEIQPRARDGRDAAAREARATSRREKLSAIWCNNPRLCTSTLFLGRSIVDALRRTPPMARPARVSPLAARGARSSIHHAASYAARAV